MFAAELDAADADDVWQQLAAQDRVEAPLAEGDIVYIGDLYFELDADGGWRPVPPGPLTAELYKAAVKPAPGPDQEASR